MQARWLNLFFRYSGYTFKLKQKIIGADNWLVAGSYAVLLIVSELGFTVVSLPIYILVPPTKVQEEGFVFPKAIKDKPQFQTYAVRRKISLATFFGAGGIFLLKLIFIGLVSSYLLGAQALLAASQDWNFSTAGDYTYPAGKIVVTGGVAQLVDQGTGGNCLGTANACNTFVTSPTCIAQAGCAWGGAASGATTNPDFTSNSTGWTGADWLWTATTETRVTSGGNPTAFIQVNIPKAKNIIGGGYWYQAFTTTAANPTATVSFDWKSIAYAAGTSVTAYVFVDTGFGVPTIGSQVWSQTITATTAWASVTNINVSSKVAAAGTYYLKVAYYVTGGSGSVGPFTVGFDNVQLNWSKAASCTGTPTACNAFVTSPTCTAQGGCAWNTVSVYPTDSPAIYPNTSLAPAGVTNWNLFTETATKNGGAINYQLSDDEGVTWQYWNGSAWAAASTAANSNSASVINTNIASFSAAAGKIKWQAFLVSNGSQQIILDNVSIGYTQNAAPSVQSLTAAQDTSSGFVRINYNLQDGNSDSINLVNYEYSLTGAFTGEELPMTAASDPAHSGITALTSSPTGVAHAFVWNAGNDLGSVFANTIYIRLRAYDGITNSGYEVSAAVSADYVLPVVSAVAAVQMPASADIQIGYNLFDHTADNILVELQVSSDGGLNWTVPVTSVSGDIGSTVSSGNGKSIIWQAGTDFANQEQNNMMVRVRAKDKYQNQGNYIDSASFVLDNRAPIIAAPVNLLAQPLAGATTVLVGGSFSEGNPNTNNFYVALNGNAYGSAEAGDTNTATPSDKSVSAAATLDGNDYISAVKIEHADDFGHLTVNENTSPNSAYKYVKPYTPPAPTVGALAENSVEVTINKHSAETDGLKYAIFENTQSLYVQSDGSLNSNPDWQAAGTVTVTGLSQPISQYIFQVKSRNTSDTGLAATSESDYSSGASSSYQSPQVVINSVAQTTNDTKYVVINYTGTDHQNQANNLTKYEYSLNGTDWQVMTEKSGVGSAGVASLAFTAAGANLVFAWDVGVDLPNVEDSTVYVRLESNDLITNSNLAVSSAFVVDTAGPVVSNIQAIQTPGTDNVSISYDLADGAGANNAVTLSVSDDSGTTYAVSAPNKTGAVGSGVTAGLARSIVWVAGVDFNNQENGTMRIKIIATDSYGNQGSSLESADFSVDTKAPVISDVVAAQDSGSALVAVTYTLADLSLADVEFSVSANSGGSWIVATTTYMGNIGLGQSAGVKNFNWNAGTDFPDQELATMKVRVRAADAFGHQSADEESSDFSVNTKVLSIANITAAQDPGLKTVTIHYDLNKTASIYLDISADSGMSWNVATTTLSGQIGDSITAGNNKTVSWNAGVDFNNDEKASLRVRLSGIDSTGVASPEYESADFSVDTAPPLGLLSLNKFASTDNSVTLAWEANTDANFSHYELWHGTNQNNVDSRSGVASKWSIANDAALNNPLTISTIITGLTLTTDYFVKIWAVDDFGNEKTVPAINVFEAPIQAPALTPISEPEAPPAGGVVLIIDSVPPAKPILNPLVTPTKETLAVISGLAETMAKIDLYDNGVLIGRLDNLAGSDGIFSQDFNLNSGDHSLTVKAIDSAGNVSPFSDPVILNITTLPPSVPIILAPKNNLSITAATLQIVGVADADNKILIAVDNNQFTAASDSNGAWSFILPSTFALSDGQHLISAMALDAAGNQSAAATLTITKTTVKAPVVPQAGSQAAVLPVVPPVSIISETTKAVELPGIPVPTVTTAGAAVSAAGDILSFSGTALPNSDVVVYIHSDQALIYQTRADAQGAWRVDHSQSIAELAPGNHTVYAVLVDPAAKIKSQPSAVATFTVSRNFWVMVYQYLNWQTTAVTLIVLLLAIFWLYRLRKTPNIIK
ncbi:MAG: Ig-like domain-containing protein [Candidatus Buchananbacteria bacterium]